MHFAVVLSGNMEPLFIGTPTETKNWLRSRETDASWSVCYGPTMDLFDVFDYLDNV